MLGVKVVIFMCVLWVLVAVVMRAYYSGNPTDAIKHYYNPPKWYEFFAWYSVACLIGIIYSVAYVLFLR